MTGGVVSYEDLQQMTYEQRRAHFAARVVPDPEHHEDARVRALFERARARTVNRLADLEQQAARSDGE